MIPPLPRLAVSACVLATLLACGVSEPPPSSPAPAPVDLLADASLPVDDPAASGDPATEAASARPEDALARAREAFDEGRLDEARQVLETCLEDCPGPGSMPGPGARLSAALHDLLGEIQALEGDLDAARDSFRTTIALDPSNAEAHFRLAALVELDEGEETSAIDRYRRAIELDPDHAQAHFQLGRLLGRGGDRPGERRHLESAVRIDPDFAIAHTYLAMALLEAGELEAAEASARQGVERMDENAFGWLLLSRVLAARGAAEAAAEAWQRGLERSPSLGAGPDSDPDLPPGRESG